MGREVENKGNRMNEIEAAKRKIRKLLSLSKSDNENEASIAIEKCNELLKQFNLKEDDVLITSNDIKTTKKHSRWRYYLASAVSLLYCTHLAEVIRFDTQDSHHFLFTGFEFDVFMAKEMYSYLEKTVLRIARKKIRKNAKKEFRESFKMGIVCNIASRIYNCPEVAWNSQDRKAKKCQITEYVDRNYTLEKCSVKTKKTLNNTAFKRGFIEGDHVSLQRQMVGSQIRQLEASL